MNLNAEFWRMIGEVAELRRPKSRAEYMEQHSWSFAWGGLLFVALAGVMFYQTITFTAAASRQRTTIGHVTSSSTAKFDKFNYVYVVNGKRYSYSQLANRYEGDYSYNSPMLIYYDPAVPAVHAFHDLREDASGASDAGIVLLVFSVFPPLSTWLMRRRCPFPESG